MTDIGLQPTEGQHDPALLFKELLRTLFLMHMNGHAFLLSVSYLFHGSFTDGDASVSPLLMDVLGAAMFPLPSTPSQCHHIQSACSVGQRHPSLFFWARHLLVLGASVIPTVANDSRHAAPSLHRHHLSLCLRGDPHVLSICDTRRSLHVSALLLLRLWMASSSAHLFLLFSPHAPISCRATFTILEKNPWKCYYNYDCL